MPVISLMSSKGGCGKSTAAMMLAGAYSEDGARVHIIDADRRRRVDKLIEKGLVPGNLTSEFCALGKPHSIEPLIETARKRFDMVIVDMEGTADMAASFAVGLSNAVIIPANLSSQDVEDGVETVRLVRAHERMTRRQIPHGLLWSRVPQFRSREIDSLKRQIEEVGIMVIGSVAERTAYKSMFSFSTTLDRLDSSEVPNLEKAREEARWLRDTVTELMVIKEEEEAA